MDLTPYYGFEEDAAHFHRVSRDALAPFGDDKYPRFKQWCDEYFFLKHRNEPRGIGGVFFDDFAELGFERSFAMMRAVGDAFLAAYLPIVQRRRDTALRRARARLPGLPARPLRRVQPGVRPRHAVRPAVGRAHREHPDVDAADREVALRLAARARHARGAAVQRLPAAARLGRMAQRLNRGASACSAAASTRCTTRTSRWRALALDAAAARRAALDPGRPALAEGARSSPPAEHREAMVRAGDRRRAALRARALRARARAARATRSTRCASCRPREPGAAVVPASSARTSTPACTPGTAGASCSRCVTLAVAAPRRRRAAAPTRSCCARAPAGVVPLPMMDISATDDPRARRRAARPIAELVPRRGGALY